MDELNPVDEGESPIVFIRRGEGESESIGVERSEGVFSVEVSLGKGLTSNGGAEIAQEGDPIGRDGEIRIGGIEGTIKSRIKMESQPVTLIGAYREFVFRLGFENSHRHVGNLGQKRRVLEGGSECRRIASFEELGVLVPCSSICVLDSIAIQATSQNQRWRGLAIHMQGVEEHRDAQKRKPERESFVHDSTEGDGDGDGDGGEGRTGKER